MKNVMMKTVLFPLLIVGAVACGSEEEGDNDVVQPTFGAGDSLSSVSQKETVEFGEAISGVFDEDASFHGYRFTSLPGGIINAEITHKGSSSKLDTTMFVFGQKGYRNWERLAFDNDAGWGKLSKIKGVELDDDYSDYMVVIGTALGTGSGKYSLTVTCANDACINTTPVVFNDCDSVAYSVYEGCVESQIDNADWGYDDPAEEWSIDYCANDAGVLEYREWECEDSNANGPDYCRATDASILNVASACEDKLKDAYNVYESLPFTRLTMPQSLESYSEALLDSSDVVYYELSAFRVPTAATSEQIGNSLRSDHPYARAFSVSSARNGSHYTPYSDELRQLKTLLDTEYGDSYYEVTDISGSYAPAAGAEEWTTMTVFHYTRKNIAYVLTEVQGD